MRRTRDVLVVGGGIAGIAIAERLAREAKRQGKLMRIMLVEREEQLATGASGGLEGWLHTGMLYTKLENPRTLINCLNSFEDLVNWYARDPLFSCRERCNLATPADGPGKPHLVPRDDGWFEDSIEFIVETDPQDPEWTASCERIHTRSAVAFHDPAWSHPTLGLCQAPHPFNPPVAPAHLHPGAESEVPPPLSTDLVMATRDLLCDLASSAAACGVKIVTGYEALIDQAAACDSSAARPKTPVRFRAIDDHDDTFEVEATQTIFAAGGTISPTDTAFFEPDQRVHLESRQSVMVVVTPPIESGNFTRFSPDPSHDLNHVAHRAPHDGTTPFSILADSNAFPVDAQEADLELAAQRLVDKAEQTLGPLRDTGHTLTWYACTKTECLVENGYDRNYCYWWGPALTQLAHDAWQTPRNNNKAEIERTILAWVIDPNTPLPAPIESDWWAMRKALHFAALAKLPGAASDDRDLLGRVRSTLHAAIERDRTRQPPAELCVVPGKFSLFPSVAHQVYLEMELRGLFCTLDDGQSPARLFDEGIVAARSARLASELDIPPGRLTRWTRNRGIVGVTPPR